MPLNLQLLSEFEFWVDEREKIRVKKEAGAPKPWTQDPILQQFKFCNIRREDDRVTKWFHENWRSEKYWTEPNFVPAIILGRTINWPATLAALGFPTFWDPVAVFNILEGLKKEGKKVYTGAYMVTQYGSTLPKNQLVVRNADNYFAYNWENYWAKMIQRTCQSVWEELQQFEGVGSFMAAQVVADLKYTDLLKDAHDWYSWAALGPGSTRGLNRLYDRPLNFQMTQKQGLDEMREVGQEASMDQREIHLQDVQNCLCEFDKYQRVKLGQGLPRSRYNGYDD